jgi:hypothetical protein
LPANSASPKVSWAISGTSRLGVVQSDHNSRDLFRGSLDVTARIPRRIDPAQRIVQDVKKMDRRGFGQGRGRMPDALRAGKERSPRCGSEWGRFDPRCALSGCRLPLVKRGRRILSLAAVVRFARAAAAVPEPMHATRAQRRGRRRRRAARRAAWDGAQRTPVSAQRERPLDIALTMRRAPMRSAARCRPRERTVRSTAHSPALCHGAAKAP